MPDTLDPYWFPCDGPLFGVPHFWNVVSNVPFLLLGIAGLRVVHALRSTGHPRLRPWTLIWLSSALLCFGSGLYHFYLTPFTLLVDRICIAGITAALLWQSLHAARRVSASWTTGIGLLTLFQLPVLAWYWLGLTSLVYGLTQAVAAVVVLVLHFRRVKREPGIQLRTWPIVALVAFYAAAKLLELGDEAICSATGAIGGHPFKHLCSAIGLAGLLVYARDDLRTNAHDGQGAAPSDS